MSGEVAPSRVHRTGTQPEHSGMHVTWSAGLSCGCRVSPGQETVPIYEANDPGDVVICDRCDEYAIVTRVTKRLVLDRRRATEMFAIGARMDPEDAEALAVEQGFDEAD